MADAGATATGLKELRALIEALPDDVTAALKSVARDTAGRIQARAQGLLRSQQKTAAHALADAIAVTEDDAQQQFVVESKAPAGQPANVPLWNERGTRFMAARPYMRPAGDAEQDRYQRDSLTAAEKVADRLGTV